MKKLMHKMMNPTNAQLGFLVLRLTLGGIFLFHGIAKLSNMEQTIGFFGMIGFSAFWAWVVALVETVGGALVIVGFGTRVASALLAIIMIVVITMVKNGGGFNDMKIDIILLGLALGIALIGCGKYSVCRLCHTKNCATCKNDTKNNTCDCNCN